MIVQELRDLIMDLPGDLKVVTHKDKYCSTAEITKVQQGHFENEVFEQSEEQTNALLID
jgi:hypothetical protein